jgi:hypothetical protein
MSQLGQERRIGVVRNISALPPRADVEVDIVEPPLSARKRPEQVQQGVAIRSPRRRGLAMCQVQSVRAALRLMTSSILIDWYTGRPQDQPHSSLLPVSS